MPRLNICPKCGMYMGEAKYIAFHGQHLLDEDHCKDDCFAGEHLHRKCLYCGYWRMERCLDDPARNQERS